MSILSEESAGMNILQGGSPYPTIWERNEIVPTTQPPNWREHDHLPNLHFWVPAVNFRGCMISIFCMKRLSDLVAMCQTSSNWLGYKSSTRWSQNESFCNFWLDKWILGLCQYLRHRRHCSVVRYLHYFASLNSSYTLAIKHNNGESQICTVDGFHCHCISFLL